MSAFSDYATSTAFAISMSRSQIDLLLFLHGKDTDSRLHNATFNSLLNKGLVERASNRIQLTEAGKLVVGLLELAGLADQPKRSQEREMIAA